MRQAQVRQSKSRADNCHFNAYYDMIRNLWGFRATRVVLREMLVPQVERSRKQLVQATQILTSDLDQLSGGAAWKQHLRLVELRAIAEKSVSSGSASQTGELSAITKRFDEVSLSAITKRFDEVSTNSQYRMISELPGFGYTLFSLRNYTNDLAAVSNAKASR